MKTIRLRPGKERSLLRRHPWIFESAIARGGADAGETVRVESDAGEFLAWAAFSPASKIRARRHLRRQHRFLHHLNARPAFCQSNYQCQFFTNTFFE